MQTVLGLSVTATDIKTVLVEGCDADGVTLEHDEFDVFSGAESPLSASEMVAEAVQSIAEADGHELHAIGVTWSESADVEASLVLDSLSARGLPTVVPVGMSEATEALARSIGKVIGYQRTAVCVVEPDAAMLTLVDSADDATECQIRRSLDDDQQLLDWMKSVFTRDDWLPEALFVVGSNGGGLAPWLEEGLGVPVYDPPEAELALAHGAALASADLSDWYGYGGFRSGPAAPDPRRAIRGPVLMLAGGAVALVVSTALAVTPHVLPDRPQLSAAVAPAAAEVPPVRDPRPPAAVVPAPAEVQPPPEAPAPAPEVSVEQMPEQAPVEAAPPPPAEAPAPPPEAPPAPVNEFHQIAPPAPAPAVVPPPPIVAPPVPEVPERRPRLRDRILDKIPGLDRFGH
ncbi:MAG: hypothetical protein U0Q20_00095 [Mycobacterium sp.]